MNFLKKYPLHVLLFAVFPILFFFSHNITETTINKTALPLSVAFVSTLVLFTFFRYLTKIAQSAGIIVSSFIFLFFSFGHVASFFGDFIGNNNVVEIIILFAWIAIFAAIIFLVVRSKKKLAPFTQILNIVSLSLITISLLNIGFYEIRSGRLFATEKLQDNLEKVTEEAKPSEPLRDIYYIIPDRYANQNVLADTYGFDNSQFINYLKEKGFYVASESYANYSKTFLSMASSLNMEYLDFLETKYPDTDDWSVTYPLIEDNEVIRTLKSLGYKFFYFGDWWEPTRVNKLADKNINYHGVGVVDEFTSKLLETTLAYPLIRNNEEWLDKVRNGHEYKFEELKKISAEPGPKLVLVHMLLPHDPYVFGKNCEPKSESPRVGTKEAETTYIEQLQCTNKKFIDLFDSILADSEPDPIIILQSDEGPFPAEYGGVGGGIDWTSLSNQALRSHMLILNAYRLPGIENKEELLYPHISPVNSFRVIFNEYFGTNLELLPDRSFIFERMERPYDFIEIKERLR